MPSKHHFAAIVIVAAVLFALIVNPAATARQHAGEDAGEDAGRWVVRGFGARIEADGDTLRSGPPIDPLPPVVEHSLTLEDGSGVGLALEYRATRRLGVEALALAADLDADFRLRSIDPPAPTTRVTRDVSSDLLGVGLNVHLTPGRRVDLYAGPLVALVRYGDLRAEAGDLVFSADFDDDTALGVTLGADVLLGSSGRWAATGTLRRLWSTTEVVDTGAELDVDPWIASAGIAYRWGGR